MKNKPYQIASFIIVLLFCLSVSGKSLENLLLFQSDTELSDNILNNQIELETSSRDNNINLLPSKPSSAKNIENNGLNSINKNYEHIPPQIAFRSPNLFPKFKIGNIEANVTKLLISPGFEGIRTTFEDRLGRIWIVFTNRSSLTTPDDDIWGMFTPDSGTTWSNPIPIVKRPGIDTFPTSWIQPNGTIWIFFSSGATNGDANLDLWGVNSHDNGTTWNLPKQITNTPTFKDTTSSPFMAKNGTFWLVYSTNRGGGTPENVFYINSNDNLKTFTPPKEFPLSSTAYNIALGTRASVTPNGTIIMQSQELNVTWASFLYKSVDDGQTWTKYNFTSYSNHFHGSVFFDSNYTITGLYYLPGSTNLMETQSFDGGITWDIPSVVANNGDYADAFIDSKGHLWVTFHSDRDGTFDIFYSVTKNYDTPNLPPEASNLLISPTTPRTDDNLSASWIYYDPGGDPEKQPQIHWYKNGILEPLLNGSLIVPSSMTNKSESWYFTLRVFDGIFYSPLYTSAGKIISNSVPIVSNITLPSTANTTTDLIASWDYFDADGDIQFTYGPYWYKDGVLDLSLTGSLLVPSGITNKSETWFFTVIAFDGETNSTLGISNSVLIGNTLPTVSNLQITPTAPYTDDDLVSSWTFNDVDNDSINGYLILWYKDGLEESAYGNYSVIPSTATSKGESWYFTIEVADDTGISPTYTSPNVVIQNTPPIVLGASIVPVIAYTSNILSASWSYADLDGDIEVTASTKIQWYRNGLLIPALTNLTMVPASYTTKGEIWNYTLQVYDGQTYSPAVSSSSVLIQNTIPVVSNVLIYAPVHSNGSIDVSWTYSDADGDTQAYYILLWYKNGILQPTLNNSLSIPSSYLFRGDVWNFTIFVNDGEDNSLPETTGVVIFNSAPTASNLQLTSPAFESSDLVASWTYYDEDSDPEIAIIHWYKNGLLELAYENSTFIPSAGTQIGESWYFSLLLFDGYEFSYQYTSPTVTVVPDGVPQFVNTPVNLTYLVGETGNTLSWTATDNNPTSFSIYHNGFFNDSGTWTDMVPIVNSVSGLSLGIHNVTILLLDNDGFSISHTVFVHVNDLPEIIDSPTDFSIQEGEQINLSYVVIDSNPEIYEVLVNGTYFTSGIWFSAVNVNISFGGFTSNTYNITVIFYDIYGYWAENSFILTINPIATSPSPPIFTSEPNNITFQLQSEGSLTWYAVDDNPSGYELERNGLIVDSDFWFSNTPISISIEGLGPGVYNFTLLIWDSDNMYVSSTVFVTVEDTGSSSSSEPDTSSNPSDSSNLSSSTSITLTTSPSFEFVQILLGILIIGIISIKRKKHV